MGQLNIWMVCGIALWTENSSHLEHQFGQLKPSVPESCYHLQAP